MRHQSRIPFRSIFRVKVSNPNTGKLIGYVGDISEEGLKMLNDAAIAIDSIHTLRLKMRVREDEVLQLDVTVTCKWSRFNAKTGYVESGFILDAPNAEFSQLVTRMRVLREGQEAEA